jgi:hypothetical protein
MILKQSNCQAENVSALSTTGYRTTMKICERFDGDPDNLPVTPLAKDELKFDEKRIWQSAKFASCLLHARSASSV